MGTLFESGKDKAAKEEGWAPPFLSSAQDTVDLLPPLPLRLLGFGKLKAFSLRLGILYDSKTHRPFLLHLL